jgi:probable HAF family extracellular repeat protein
MSNRPLGVLATLCSVAGLALGSTAANAQASLLTDLGTDSGLGINNSGEVLLSSGIYSNGSVTVFPASFTGAAAINASGAVAGLAIIPFAETAGVYENGTVTVIGVFPPGDPTLNASMALGINGIGQVVGWSTTATTNSQDGFIYTNGLMGDVGDFPGSICIPGILCSEALGINDAGQVTGFALNDSNALGAPTSDAFLYDNGKMTDLGPGSGNAINASGQVTGGNDAPGHAFIYANGAMTDLGTLPGGATSTGYAINATGQIVGASAIAGSATTHAFFYNGAMQDMNSLVSATDPLKPYVTLTDAHGINDSRLIVVNGVDSRTHVQHAYLLQGPWLDLAPGQLSFPSQAIGTVSSAQSVSLTNSGPTALAIGTISTSSNFGQSNNCGTSLAPSSGCKVMVTFAPTAAGNLTGALTGISAGVPIAIPLAGTAPIQVTISSSAATTTTGVPVKLSWTASPGTSCTATGGSPADKWTGTIVASGTQSVTESTATTYHYGLTCKVGSQSASAATTVTDNAPSPAQSAGGGGSGGGGALDQWAVLFLTGAAALRRLRQSNPRETSRWNSFPTTRSTARAWSPSTR